ncbi:MAG: MauE/DoxX family redox-associated membrane protein [Sphingobacterium sp.]
MNKRIKSTALFCLQLLLMVFWIYVAVDKLWDLGDFHLSLQRQPFPDWWADILFWLLPLLELAIGFIFILPNTVANTSLANNSEKTGGWLNQKHFNRANLYLTFSIRKKQYHILSPFLLSAALLIIFSVYIALGVIGFYAERPCGCASVFSGLSWTTHLIVNIILLGLSVLGWYLSARDNRSPKDMNRTKIISSDSTIHILNLVLASLMFHLFNCKRFPKKFALFTIMPVMHWPTFTFVMFS